MSVATTISILIYLLPTLVAVQRKHNDSLAIAVMSILTGWLFGITWFIGLIWSMTGNVKQEAK